MVHRMDPRDAHRSLPKTVEALSDRLRDDPAFKTWLEREILRGTVPLELEVLTLRLMFSERFASDPSSP